MDSQKIPKPICVLTSGGVDSSLLLQEALNQNKQVFPLYMRCGFLWEEAELFWLKRLLAKLSRSDLKPLKIFTCDLKSLLPRHFGIIGKNIPDAASVDSAVYIPGRNLLLTTIAAIYGEMEDCREIWIGTLKNNPFHDGKKEFFDAQMRAFSAGLEQPLSIQNPFGQLTKRELVRKFPNFPLEYTFSCLQPKGMEHCGACNKCEERNKVLRNASI